MFDDQNINQPAPPANLPSEPEDMFSSVEPAPTVATAGAEGTVAEATTEPTALSAGFLKKRADDSAGMPVALPESGPSQYADLPPMESVAPISYATKDPVLGKIFLVIIILAVVAGVAFGVIFLYRNYFTKSTPTPPVDVANTLVSLPDSTTGLPPYSSSSVSQESVVVSVPEGQSVTSTLNSVTGTGMEVGAAVKNRKILFGDQLDSDNDGLPDDVEAKLGTDPHNPDTDGDGLADGEEVITYHTNPLKPDTDEDGLSDFDEIKIWHTDPLNPDTDGDGFKDGAEVKNGYNPLGPGKLFNIPTTTPSVASTTKATTTVNK